MRNFDPLIGVPFAYRGRGPDTYDCYGLVRECLKRWDGVDVPDYVSPSDGGRITAMFALELRLWEPCEPRAGTVAVIQVPGNMHCGYLLDSTNMLHTWEVSGGVVKEPLEVWKRRIKGFYRYVG